jgi:hypothetical protein
MLFSRRTKRKALAEVYKQILIVCFVSICQEDRHSEEFNGVGGFMSVTSAGVSLLPKPKKFTNNSLANGSFNVGEWN